MPQNGTLPLREQETSCLTISCLMAVRGPQASPVVAPLTPSCAAEKPPRPAPSARAHASRPDEKPVETGGRVPGGVEGRRPVGSYVPQLARGALAKTLTRS
jgi:hypothetical protein